MAVLSLVVTMPTNGTVLTSVQNGTDRSLPEPWLFDLFAHADRRVVMSYLRGQRTPTSLTDLATALAAWTTEKRPAAVTDEEQRVAKIAVYHRHLPKLEAARLVERDGERVVETVERADVDSRRLDALVSADADDERLESVFRALAHPLRRTVLTVLRERSGEDSVSVEDVATAVVESGRATTKKGVTVADVREVATSLHHQHLPMLADAGLLAYDPERDVVSEGRSTLHEELAVSV